MREQDEHIHIRQPAKRLDRGRACVARCGAHNRDPLARACKCGLKQLADQLHGEIFERQRGAVKQLQQEVIGPKLLEGARAGCSNPA
jgi:hypothetical protein